jgi:hypothetical protein
LLTKEEMRRIEMAENITYVTTGYRVTSYEYSEDTGELKLRDINPIIKPLESNRLTFLESMSENPNSSDVSVISYE